MKISNIKYQISKLILILGILVFAFGIVFLSVIQSAKQTIAVATKTFKIESVLSSPIEEKTSVSNKVEYFLAYPGILPDHFLYPIKMIRDRIWLFLTTDPLKRGETLLLFADKRLGAGRALIEGGKEELGIRTLTKAEKYLEQVVAQEKVAREKGRDTNAFLEKLSKAAKKHEEVLVELQEKVSEGGKEVIKEMLRYPRQAYEEVERRLGGND